MPGSHKPAGKKPGSKKQDTRAPEIIGYSRNQDRTANYALQDAGCTRIFTDTASGSKAPRPGWEKLMAEVQNGDTVVVVKLSTMAVSPAHLLELLRRFEETRVRVRVLQEGIDTGEGSGRALVGGIVAGLEMVGRMMQELKAEQLAGARASARARGRSGGRPRTSVEVLERARVMYEQGVGEDGRGMTAKEVCKECGIGRNTLFRWLKERKG